MNFLFHGLCINLKLGRVFIVRFISKRKFYFLIYIKINDNNHRIV